MRTIRLQRITATGLGGALLIGVTVYAATSVTIGVGTLEHFAPFGGPATITTADLPSRQMKCWAGTSIPALALTP